MELIVLKKSGVLSSSEVIENLKYHVLFQITSEDFSKDFSKGFSKDFPKEFSKSF